MVASSPFLAAEAISSEGVVAASVYVDGRRVANIAIDEASSWRSRPGHVVWIGLHEPDIALLTSVQQQFQLHDLAIEDADHAHQRPKIEQYGDGLFIVARTAQLVGDSIAFGETHLFVGEGYLVSVRHGASTSYTPGSRSPIQHVPVFLTIIRLRQYERRRFVDRQGRHSTQRQQLRHLFPMQKRGTPNCREIAPHRSETKFRSRMTSFAYSI